jgi:hypothetical protein
LSYAETVKRLPQFTGDVASESKSEGTIWRDVLSGVIVKTKIVTTYLGVAPNPTTYAGESSELVGYANAASKTSKPAIERFVGKWSATYSGGTTGTCDVAISLTGGITGTCTPTGGLAFAINGTVDIQGNVALDPTPALGSGFSGKLTSPLEGSGKTQVGTWTISHK